MIARRASYATTIGGVAIGGDAPVVVQSMTNTDTADVAATVAQVRALAEAGLENRCDVHLRQLRRAQNLIRARGRNAVARCGDGAGAGAGGVSTHDWR